MTTGMSKWWRRIAAFGTFAVVWSAGFEARAARSDGDVPIAALGADASKRSVAPIAPSLPGAVVAAIQGGQYPEAIAALDGLIADAKTPRDDGSFYRLVRGETARLADHPDEARAGWLAAIEADPKGLWANKLRGALAALELATGHPDRAEVLARTEAETLLNPDRKDRLAEVYRDFARRLLEPDFPGAKPNPVAAYALLSRGHDLAKGPKQRASLLFAMGRAGQKAFDRQKEAPGQAAGPVPNPILDYKAYLKEYPQGEDRERVRFHLGEILREMGNNVEARSTWTDLARDLAKLPDLDKERRGLRGQALYGIAKTYGMPTPGDRPSLSLGVAALDRFLRDTPADPKAPLAAFEIGEAYLNQGQTDPAIAAFVAFLKGNGYRVESEEARRTRADLAMRATFAIAKATLGQEKFAEAVTAFESYLNQYPNGPESGDARRAILDTQFREADDAFNREKFGEARAGWLRFAEAHPLDDRVPLALFDVGRAFASEKKWDEAIAAWDTLTARFPATEPAAHGQFEAASTIEVEEGDPSAAIERFRKVAGHAQWVAQANQRIAVMESKALVVVSPRAFRSGETAQLKISTRNLEKLNFSAYKLNPEAYFRKKHGLGGVGSLDIGLVAPDAEWTVPVPNYARYKPVQADFDLKVSVPGVYVVKVSDEKFLQASALVIGSDLDAIIKVSRDQLLVFAQDMKTGKGRKGAKVLVADGANVVYEGTTGEDGVVQGVWNNKPIGAADRPGAMVAPDASLQYLVLDGLDAAGSGLGVPDQIARGLSPRAYIDTDRPAYRPGQEVLIRGVIRETKDGQYANPSGVVYKLEVLDSQGRLLLAKDTTLSPFGTFRDSIRIDSGAPVGSYRIRLWKPGGSDFSGGFEVQAYQLEKLGLEFDLPRTVYDRGETVRGTLKARYGFDAPASGRPIEVRLPDGRTLRGTTDPKGEFAVEFPTEGFAEEQTLALVAWLPADNVSARASVRVAVQGFGINLATPRNVYLDGETFTLSATTLDPLGRPLGQELRLSVIKPVPRAGAIIEREVGSQTFRTDKATGKGEVSVRIAESDKVAYILRVAGTDRMGRAIVADYSVTVSGKDDDETLRILADRTSYKVGETGSVRLINRSQPGTALIAWEADRILRYRLAPIRDGENAIDWPVDGSQFPNFTLTASRMVDQKFAEARLDIKVERDLRLTLKPKASSVAPGSEIEVEITAVDQTGRPAQAEVALALVDRTLLARFGDKLPQIGPFFYDQTRLGSFRTEATNTFKDEPKTEPVVDAVVDEAERQAELARQDIGREAVINEMRSVLKNVRNQNSQGMMTDGSRQIKPGVEGTPMTPLPAPMVGAGGLSGSGQEGFAGGGGGGGGPGPVERRNRVSGSKESPFPNGEADLAKSPSEDKAKDVADDGFGQWSVGLRFSTPRSKIGNAPTSPRQSFVETAYWNPSVITGADGKATVKFKAPEALSEYRLMAKGVTGADTLVGQSSINVAVRKDFYVELRTPGRLTEGDKPRFVARVHHVGIAPGSVVQVRLSSYAGDQDQVDPKTVTIAGDGVSEVIFDPITIPDAESIKLNVSARSGELVDELAVEIPIRPWGVQALATASGTSSDSTTAFVALPAGRAYDDVAMRIQLAPTLDRLVVELAMSQGYFISYGDRSNALKDLAIPAPFAPPISIDTTADRASDLLAAVSALAYLRDVRSTNPEEATRVRDRARGLVAELVSTQNGDGGWAWVAPQSGQNRSGSDRIASSMVAWSLREASGVGIDVDPNVLNRAGDYLSNEFARIGGNDPSGKAAVFHALAVLGKAGFEQANTLNRGRQNLGDAALAHLAMALGLLDRPTLAGEVLDLLATRGKSEVVGPGQKPQKYWEGKNGGPWHRGRADATALVALAFARVRPRSPEMEQSVDWLLAHRTGLGWNPHKAKGPAVAAIAASKGKAGEADDRYRLVVSVNDAEVARLEVLGATESSVIPVPRKVLKVGASNAVRFRIEGRGTFGYSATLTGFARDFAPEQKPDGKLDTVRDRAYLPVAPELDGKPLPTGFSKVINPTPFVNKASEVARGGRVEVKINFNQVFRPGKSVWDREFLIVEETLPAGTTLVDGSVRTSAGSYTLADGVLTFAFSPDNGFPTIQYELAGYLPGQYRSLPTKIRNAYDPGTVHLGPLGALKVLAPGEPATDPYRASPDELLARGQGLADAGKLAEAAVPLEELFGGYTPLDDVARDAARILLSAHIQSYDPRKVVRDFEILKEKGPEVVIPFDEVLVVGRAYRDLGEFERAFLVFRALAEASYLEDAQVGEVLRQNGQTLEAITYLLNLWRESPRSASIEGDLFGLSQVLTDAAARALSDPSLRGELAKAGISRLDLLAQSIRLIQTTLALGPKTPPADEASLALLSNELDLENFEAVIGLAPRFASLYPKSPFLDSFQYADALGRFQLGQYDKAIEVAEKIAKATYPDPNGVPQASPNKWQALYILGQIHDARRRPAEAITFYKQVADRFGDAADAALALGRRALKLPEVTIVRPKALKPGEAVRITSTPDKVGGVVLSYRNVAEVDLKVYPVDLMRLYLTRRNLDGIAGIDLAGITPLHEATIKLGDAMTYADATKTLDLPIAKEGAYLVMVRGGDLYASGIVLVSPIELDVTEEADAGRVRVVVRDAESKNFVPKVQVKVIGSNNPSFTDGRTDLRGVAVAEGINGQVTAVARNGTGQYAFYRGNSTIGNGPTNQQPRWRPDVQAAAKGGNETLEQNLKSLNLQNQTRGIDRLQKRYGEGRKGIRAEEAK